MSIISANNNINGEVVAGGGLVADDQTYKQITRALVANTTNTAAAVAAAAAAATTANKATSGLVATNSNLASLQSTVTGLGNTVTGLSYVASIGVGTPETGVITLAGSCVVQVTSTFSFFPNGAQKAVAPSYAVLTTDTFLIVTPTGAGQTITLPSAASVGANWALRIHNGSNTTGFTIATHAGDLFNAVTGATTYAINPLGSTAYIGTELVSNGAGAWWSKGYN
jgi:hypothetical protein